MEIEPVKKGNIMAQLNKRGAVDKKTANRKNFEAEAFPHLEALWQTSLWLTENENDAINLVQNVFVKAYRLWRQSFITINCRVFLFKTLAGIFFRDYQKDSELPACANADDMDESFFYDRASLLRAIPNRVVNKAITGLLAEIRFVTLLSMFWGFTYEEIAGIVGAGPEVIKSRLYWGRRLIRRELNKYMLQKSSIGTTELNRQ
jgi:RNA polymerase sigma-70 factor, ECF subfamily